MNKSTRALIQSRLDDLSRFLDGYRDERDYILRQLPNVENQIARLERETRDLQETLRTE